MCHHVQLTHPFLHSSPQQTGPLTADWPSSSTNKCTPKIAYTLQDKDRGPVPRERSYPLYTKCVTQTLAWSLDTPVSPYLPSPGLAWNHFQGTQDLDLVGWRYGTVSDASVSPLPSGPVLASCLGSLHRVESSSCAC
jgi:hypothetical protein